MTTNVGLTAQELRELAATVAVAVESIAGVQARLEAAGGPQAPAASSVPYGDLGLMFRMGITQRGDIFYAQHKGSMYTATVTDIGNLEVEGVDYNGPSPAIGAATGTPQNGWIKWRRVGDNVRMQELRNQARQRAGKAAVKHKLTAATAQA